MRRSIPRILVSMAAAMTLVAIPALAQEYHAQLNSAQEPPCTVPNPAGQPGTGTACFWLDGQNRLHYLISYRGLSGAETGSHIHTAPPGACGGVTFNLGGSNIKQGVVGPLNAAQLGNLNAGNMYVNIHTSAFGGGEIRGQIVMGPNPALCEVDMFPNSIAKVVLNSTLGPPETVVLTGPSRVIVQRGTVADRLTAPNGREQVPIEMVAMNLTGTTTLFGPAQPIEVSLQLPSPGHTLPPPSFGEIEETTNTGSNNLDLPPFAPNGTADSFFDVFFEVRLPSMAPPNDRFHNHAPTHMATLIRNVPPIPGDNYESPAVIPLFDTNENPAPFNLAVGPVRHAPDPIEKDQFPNSHAMIEIVSTTMHEVVALDGPSAVDVAMWNVGDRNGNGRDEVDTEMVQLQLTGTSPLLGTVMVHPQSGPYPGPGHPTSTAILGKIEESAQTMPNRLDLQPFAPAGTAASFFDVFFEVEIPSLSPPMNRLHNHITKVMTTIISYKPPAPGETYEGPVTIALHDANCNPVPITVGRARHTPNTGPSGGVGVEPGGVPERVAIQDVRPNPFNASTTVSLALPKRARASLVVYDVSGRVVRNLANRVFDAGIHPITWNGRNDAGKAVAPGVYFAILESDGLSSVRRIVMLQ